MIELFVLKSTDEPFKYFLPNGKIIEHHDGLIDFRPIREFLDAEIKVVFYPTHELVNQGNGEVEIQIFDDVEEAYKALPHIFPKNFL